MTDLVKYFTQEQMISEVERRGYSTAPFTNDDEKVVGYRLKGPRGHKTFVAPNEDGFYSALIVVLWCDGVDYAEKKYEESRRRVG